MATSTKSANTPPDEEFEYMSYSDLEILKDKACYYDLYEKLTGVSICEVVDEKLRQDSSRVEVYIEE